MDYDRNEINMLLNCQLPEGWQRVSSSTSAWVAYRPGNSPYYFKKFLARSSLEGVKGFFRGTRAERFVRESNRLISRGFVAPEVVDWGKLGYGNSWVLCRAIKGQGAFDFWRDFLADKSHDIKRAFCVSIGREVARLHKSGIMHGDLRLNNMLVISGDIKEWKFAFLDNERNKAYSKLPFRAMLRNLVQLNMIEDLSVRRVYRIYFFLGYARILGLSKPEIDKLLAAVELKTSIRKGRKL